MASDKDSLKVEDAPTTNSKRGISAFFGSVAQPAHPTSSLIANAGRFTGVYTSSSPLGLDELIKTYNVEGNSIPDSIRTLPENQLLIQYRALSAHRVGVGTTRQMNFGYRDVLRRAMRKLLGVPAVTDHNGATDNIRGSVQRVAWGERTDTNPAGINCVIEVDSSRHPVLANNLAEGRINNVSVRVEYEWEWSHKILDELSWGEKLRLLGTQA